MLSVQQHTSSAFLRLGDVFSEMTQVLGVWYPV